MKTLKLQNVLMICLTILVSTIIVTSCEQAPTIHPDNTAQDTQSRYIFEGLKPLNDDALIKERKQDVTYFERDEKAFKEVMTKQPKFMTFNIPLSSQVIELELEKWSIFSDDFTWEDENGQELSFDNSAIFYNGKVKGDPNSIVAVSVFEDDLSVSIMNSDNIQVVEQEDNLMSFHEVDEDILNLKHMFCHTHTDLPQTEAKLVNQNTINHRADNCNYDPIRIRYVVDHSFKSYFWLEPFALNYLSARFNEVKAIYAARNIPIVLQSTYVLPAHRALAVNYSAQNILSRPFDNFKTRFGVGSNNWDVQGAVVALYRNGSLTGTGLGISAHYNNEPPICQRGAGINTPKGYLPLHIAALTESSPGNPNNTYFTYVLAHELGHNFGISHEYDNVTGDIMDHWAPSITGSYPLHIAHTTYVNMYNSWTDCYENDLNQPCQ